MMLSSSMCRIAALLVALVEGEAQDVEVPWLCGGACASNMVLQRAPLRSRLWGVPGAAPGTSTVSVSVDGADMATTETKADGSWQLDLPAMAASSGHAVSIRVGDNLNADLSNVAFGDVYICGGQSNMEFAVPGVYNVDDDVADSVNYPDLRLFTVQKVQSAVASDNVSSKTHYTWGVASPATIQSSPLKVGSNFGWFSAVCYFFGRDTYKALGGKVPIGLVASNWGGTPVEAWSSPEALSKCDTEAQTGKCLQCPQHRCENCATLLYNAMIAPLLPMRFTGEVWYQGEQNSHNPRNYACRFPAMIADYREKFGLPDFSFFYVELAAINADWAEIRRAQKEALELPNVGFGTAIDLGFKGAPVHSPRKQEVGRRLSLSAQAMHYKLPVVHEGPTMERVHVNISGSEVHVVISFRSAENLHAHGTADCSFVGSKLCCDESPFLITWGSKTVRANYSLDSRGEEGTATLVADLGVTVDDASQVFVSLEFEGFPQCALYNGKGGPDDHTGVAASPFSTTPKPWTPIPVPTPSPVPTPVGPCIMPDVLYDSHKEGNTLLDGRSRKVADTAACQSLCHNTSSCVCFSYRKSLDHCWLMKECQHAEDNDLYDSGRASCRGDVQV